MTADQIAAERVFPRIYRVDERTRHAVNFFCVALMGLFLSLTGVYTTGLLPYRGSLGDLFWVDLIVAGLVLLLGSFYNKKAILYEDSIEVAGWFYSRSLKFKEIRGRQTSANSRLPYGYAYILIPSDQSKRKLALPHYLRADQFFRDWIKAIPKVPR